MLGDKDNILVALVQNQLTGGQNVNADTVHLLEDLCAAIRADTLNVQERVDQLDELIRGMAAPEEAAKKEPAEEKFQEYFANERSVGYPVAALIHGSRIADPDNEDWCIIFIDQTDDGIEYCVFDENWEVVEHAVVKDLGYTQENQVDIIFMKEFHYTDRAYALIPEKVKEKVQEYKEKTPVQKVEKPNTPVADVEPDAKEEPVEQSPPATDQEKDKPEEKKTTGKLSRKGR